MGPPHVAHVVRNVFTNRTPAQLCLCFAVVMQGSHRSVMRPDFPAPQMLKNDDKSMLVFTVLEHKAL